MGYWMGVHWVLYRRIARNRRVDDEHRLCGQPRQFGLAVLLKSGGAQWQTTNRYGPAVGGIDGSTKRSVLRPPGSVDVGDPTSTVIDHLNPQVFEFDRWSPFSSIR